MFRLSDSCVAVTAHTGRRQPEESSQYSRWQVIALSKVFSSINRASSVIKKSGNAVFTDQTTGYYLISYYLQNIGQQNTSEIKARRLK